MHILSSPASSLSAVFFALSTIISHHNAATFLLAFLSFCLTLPLPPTLVFWNVILDGFGWMKFSCHFPYAPSHPLHDCAYFSSLIPFPTHTNTFFRALQRARSAYVHWLCVLP
uniref:Uncharacterized protein n=1 Tax=Anopheles darlingi TaxID=43151 RepID=A0A2M4DBW8_ANODA